MTFKEKLVHYFLIITIVGLYIMISGISMIHSIEFFELSNPRKMAITIAIAFEIGAAACLAAIVVLKKIKAWLIWSIFIILTLIQSMSNAYYAFAHLHDFNKWIELFGLTDLTLIEQGRILSIVSAALLPVIALGFIKSLVDYLKPDEIIPEIVNNNSEEIIHNISDNDIKLTEVKIDKNEESNIQTSIGNTVSKENYITKQKYHSFDEIKELLESKKNNESNNQKLEPIVSPITNDLINNDTNITNENPLVITENTDTKIEDEINKLSESLSHSDQIIDIMNAENNIEIFPEIKLTEPIIEPVIPELLKEEPKNIYGEGKSKIDKVVTDLKQWSNDKFKGMNKKDGGIYL